jgi:flagellar biosynthesis protein FlhB
MGILFAVGCVLAIIFIVLSVIFYIAGEFSPIIKNIIEKINEDNNCDMSNYCAFSIIIPFLLAGLPLTLIICLIGFIIFIMAKSLAMVVEHFAKYEIIKKENHE